MSSSSLSISGARSILSYLESSGLIDTDIKEILRSSTGISDDILAQPDYRLSIEQYKALWEIAVKVSGNPAIGLLVGQASSYRTASLISGLLTHGDSFEQGLRDYVEYSEILNTGTKAEFEINGSEAQFKLRTLSEGSYCIHEAERVIAVLSKRFEFFFKGEISFTTVYFEHPEPIYFKEYEKIFDCKIVFNASYTGISFPSSVFEHTSELRNPYIYKSILKQARAIKKKLSSKRYASRVEELLYLESEYYGIDIETVSEKLNMNRQTLYRKLKTEGISFSDLLKKVKKTRALEYLLDPNVTLCDIAYTLGFSDSSSFSRAFKTWTGISPKNYRKQHLATG